MTDAPTRWLAVEGLALRAPLTGVGRYTGQLLHAVLEQSPDLGVDLLVVGGEDLDLSLLGAHESRVTVHRRRRPSANVHRLMIGTMRRPRVESLFPVAERAAALLWPNFVRHPNLLGIPEVVVIYDATFRTHPEDKAWWFNLGWGRLVQQALDSPARCVSISRAAADDVSSHFRVRETLDVLYPGLPVPTSIEPPDARDPYFLVIGTASPRKNIDVVLRAHERLDARSRPRLVVVGRGHEQARAAEVRGYVDDIEMAGLIAGASAVITPSLAEGFDLPVVEALALGTPVIASDIPVHREVLGDDWPWLFDPANPADLARLLSRGEWPSSEPDLARFAWDETAEHLLALLGLGPQRRLADRAD